MIQGNAYILHNDNTGWQYVLPMYPYKHTQLASRCNDWMINPSPLKPWFLALTNILQGKAMRGVCYPAYTHLTTTLLKRSSRGDILPG